jgi:hypothetical protein
MYDFHPLPLDLATAQVTKLKALYASLLEQLEGQHTLDATLFAGLSEAMRECLFQQPRFGDIWRKAETTHHIVHLQHGDELMLNKRLVNA